MPSSLSLEMMSKIPTTEDYCAGTSVYGKLLNALIELVFQLKERKQKTQYFAHACSKKEV